ncbi:MAG: hypothetical protein R2754_12695 [Microthrixaceae bacterium]
MSLNNLGARLSNSADEPKRSNSTQEAVTLYRELAADTPPTSTTSPDR